MLFKKEKDSNLNSLNFNILDENDVVEKHRYVWRMLSGENFNFIEEFCIPMKILCNFLCCLKRKYNKKKNPFHNYDHGISGYT